MNDNQVIKRRSHRPQGNGFSIKLFTIASILIAVVCVLNDNGPPLPPFKKQFTSFDCHSISFESFKDREGQIDFKFRTSPSVEYPPEYLPHFLTINIRTGPVSMRYSGDEIENITRTEKEIGFSIDHTFAGHSVITAQCLNNPSQSLSGNLRDIVIKKPQYSTSDTSGLDHAKFHDVCLEYEKFLYFVTLAGDRPAVTFDDGTLRFEMLKWPLDAYMKHKSVELQKKTCFIVAPIDKKPWKAILMTLIPLSISVDRNEKNSNNVLFIFRKSVPPEAKDALKFLSPNEPVKLDDIMCFPTLLMTATYSKIDKRINEIGKILDLDLNPLRSKISRSSTEMKKIVVSETLWDSLNDELKKLPGTNVVKLNQEESNNNAAVLVSSAHVFIGDHITNLIHTIWMNSGTTVIDATSEDYACNKWAEKLAKKIGVNYRSINGGSEKEGGKCKCPDFSCYMTKPSVPTDVKVKKIVEEVRNGLKEE